jgi:hypothetical protein
MIRRILATLGVLITLLSLLACASLKKVSALPFQHPQVFENMAPVCTDCHDARTGDVHYELFNHTSFFARNHRMEAFTGMKVCNICHTQRDCDECHGQGIELKPSQKNQIETYRKYPHRGDYLSRHQIDGRIDPTSCFRCHGNPKSASTRAKCHG